VRSVLVVAAVALVGCGRPAVAPVVAVDETPAAEQLTPDDAPIGLRRSVVADEWFWLRTKALEGEAPAPFVEALSAMKELRSALGADASQWEDLELPLGTASRASELVGIYGALPERVDVGGGWIELRALALKVARALEASELAYRHGPYREHDAATSRAARELAARLVPSEAAIAQAIETDMALPGAPRPLVITLVGDAPYQGSFAADDRGQTTATFVRVRGLEGTALVETVLTEALHAIDEITVKAPTAMNMLRGSLEQRGLDASDANVEMAVNTVTFAEAASLVRRFVDPHHKANGEGGFYAIFPPAPAIVLAWERHVDGEELQATADAIGAALGAP
jgi:hypothetical protein